MPYCFTEPGVAMLSSILNSERAIDINIQIIRTFIKMRTILNENMVFGSQLKELVSRVDSHDQSINIIFQYIDELGSQMDNPKEIPTRTRIGYKPEE